MGTPEELNEAVMERARRAALAQELEALMFWLSCVGVTPEDAARWDREGPMFKDPLVDDALARARQIVTELAGGTAQRMWPDTHKKPRLVNPARVRR
jgi:hypothetical protein